MTSTAQPQRITSRDNPLLQRLRKLARDPAAYRKLGAVWLEGDHLAAACLARGHRPSHCVITESGWLDGRLHALAQSCERIAIVPDDAFKSFSALESPAAVGFVLELPVAQALLPGVPTVVLDRLQDAGNVGAILRSAAALGVRQVVALKGSAALWSPKVLRAAMGAHFALQLAETLSAGDLHALQLPLVATSSHGGEDLPAADLPRPCAWVFGHEGQGVDAALLDACALKVRIPQPGGEESLNVAAAAAICLYESLRRGL